MTFPVEILAFGFRLHPHPVMELIGYAGGSQLYFWLRRRDRRQAPVPIEPNLWLIVGCVFGALVGAKLLALAENWRAATAAVAKDGPVALVAGKTIVGGLLGGWAGVEVAKRFLGVRQSTGDLFVFPLAFGIAVGRVGCFLTGLADHTHGVATTLPWGVDFGDGVRRHPTQLYEIGFLLLLAVGLYARLRRPSGPGPARPSPNDIGPTLQPAGAAFRAFLFCYLAFRFVVEFIKPSDKPLLGLSAIQAACLLGCVACAASLARRRRRKGTVTAPAGWGTAGATADPHG
ncbi:MAG: Prolipoprotein diacylglyceryltransferase [Phycisphaerales bacterium]|nr:Prolipoprotein diacylglyceryltransferase [Phycisphaerales bacterium]